MIQALLISVVARKYADEPQTRGNAARLLLIYAVQLAVHHLGRDRAASIVSDELSENDRRAA